MVRAWTSSGACACPGAGSPSPTATRATARLLPRARVVELRGNGHDQVDSDATGCIARALSRWVNRERFGSPCAGKSNQVDVIPQPPRKLSEFKPSRQVPGRRGSVLLAAMETASELRFTAIEAVFAGLEPRGGGLRGGSYAASDAFEGGATARGYEYVPGVRLSGRLKLGFRRVTGHVTVRGAIDGELEIDTRRGASGVLGGKRVRYRRSRAGAAGLGPGIPQIPRALLTPAALRRHLTAQAER